MITPIELIDSRIICIKAEGRLTTPVFEQHTQDRCAYAKQHIDGFYVLIYDLSEAKLTPIDLKTTRQAAQIDPNLKQIIVVSTELLAAFGVRTLTEVFRLKVAHVKTRDEAIEKARAVVANELAQLQKDP